ncbi:MAG: GWxTD domain-containing protein [Bacteroidia bacterium]
MRKLKLWIIGALVGGVNRAQGVWIERGAEREAPPLVGRLYRTAPREWVFYCQIRLEPWLPYVFEGKVPVLWSFTTAEGLKVDTLVHLPYEPVWAGAIQAHLPSEMAGNNLGVQASCTEAPGLSYYCNVWCPEGISRGWVEAFTPVLTPPVRVHLDSLAGLARPGDSLWQRVFCPAQVDTTPPLPPYVVRRRRRPPKPVYLGCTWYLRGDTTQIFWTCSEPLPPYRLPSAAQKHWRQRAPLAYQRFSAHKPGERSDRGLIYLVYGEPSLRLLTPQQETWVYLPLQLSFYFRAVGGDWELVRRLEYQGWWERR